MSAQQAVQESSCQCGQQSPALAAFNTVPTGGGHTPAGPWVAPEVWGSSQEKPFNDKADVWALAVSWIYAFRADYTPQQPGTLDDDPLQPAKVDRRPEHGLLCGVVKQILLEDRITQPFCHLLLSMLSWDSAARPSAAEALCHLAWEPLRIRKELEREDRIRTPSEGAKKVRLLSPEDL
ncbi:hypothetical protein M406DRAFT_332019 [Cryphonectria parasitica EP155]|uniref:Protein kinase domain-containing protein n=1 Tax=Cryphonectria parasitica (strain ATCC 38755 / EP155) TaxID=660469 RepID=A0A9P4XZ17_CRYP1|nr:uncharacterized protein M406DRAFT_332019 [Cryphonectria parasitica EP155]KAF3763531.1 hypothetical protein M406DRAFT_332019 [Cryphonectria parasitica EP155]